MRAFLLMLILLVPLASAAPLESYHVRIDLENNLVKHLITADEGGNFTLKLQETQYVSLESGEFKEIQTTTSFDPENFVMSLTAPVSTDLLQVSLILPKEAVLKKKLSEDMLTSGSVFPKPTVVTSDGQSLILSWAFLNVKKGDDHSFFVQYKTTYTTLPYILLFLAVIFGAYGWSRKAKNTEVVRDVHLKEHEEQIVNILKQRDEQSIDQGTLRVITGWSKAHLSRILKEMNEREIIHKEHIGKKHRIFLKK